MWRGVAILVAAVGGITFYIYSNDQETRHQIQLRSANASAQSQNQARIAQIEAEIQQNRQIIDNLRRNNVPRQNLADLQRRLDDAVRLYEDKIQSQSNEISLLNETVTNKDKMIDELEEKTNSLQSDVDRLNESNTNLRTLVRRLQSGQQIDTNRRGSRCPQGSYLTTDGYCYKI